MSLKALCSRYAVWKKMINLLDVFLYLFMGQIGQETCVTQIDLFG